VPESEQCGWCKDQFGLSWQILPANMDELTRTPAQIQVMMRQKKIVIGAHGETIKRISMEAREDIAGVAGVPVHLFLFVKVRERWGEDPERYREMGLDYPKE